MKKIYSIKDRNLLVECSINEYDELIINRLSMFEQTDKYDCYIKIKQNKTIFRINSVDQIINGQLKHTDLYQLINNIISNIINDSENVYIHSAVIEKNNKGILILGDFNSGKSTLCIESLKAGYQILSADQSWLNYKNNLFLKKGSKYLAYKNNFEIIDACNEKCEIKAIFIIKAIFDTSNYEFYIENNKYRNIKNITKYCSWSINNVLMTDDFELELNRKVINEFVSKINIPIYTVFGNKSDIIKKMEEI